MHYFLWVGPGVVNVYLCSVLVEFFDYIYYFCVADVGAVFFEGYAEYENLCSFDFMVSGYHELDHLGCDISTHVVVEPSAGKNDFKVVTVLLCLFGLSSKGQRRCNGRLLSTE